LRRRWCWRRALRLLLRRCRRRRWPDGGRWRWRLLAPRSATLRAPPPSEALASAEGAPGKGVAAQATSLTTWRDGGGSRVDWSARGLTVKRWRRRRRRGNNGPCRRKTGGPCNARRCPRLRTLWQACNSAHGLLGLRHRGGSRWRSGGRFQHASRRVHCCAGRGLERLRPWRGTSRFHQTSRWPHCRVGRGPRWWGSRRGFSLGDGQRTHAAAAAARTAVQRGRRVCWGCPGRWGRRRRHLRGGCACEIAAGARVFSWPPRMRGRRHRWRRRRLRRLCGLPSAPRCGAASPAELFTATDGVVPR